MVSSSLEEAGSTMLELLEKLETGAEDLGVDPSELLDNYEIKRWLRKLKIYCMNFM
jgi:hypothetical protein